MQKIKVGAKTEKPKVVAILQARMASTRLPNKVLTDIIGHPMLGLLMARLRQAQLVDDFVIATTDLSEDQQIEDYASTCGIACFRGSRDDLTDRYFRAATAYHADVVVRLTADNPLIDAGFLDWAVSEHLAGMPSYDYVDTVHSKTFPLGMSVEVMGFAALETAWNEDTNKAWREHCTPFIYYHPERYRLRHLSTPDNYSHMRWTVDTPEDLAFVRQIYAHFGHPHFNWRDVIALLALHPEWSDINRNIVQKTLTAEK